MRNGGTTMKHGLKLLGLCLALCALMACVFAGTAMATEVSEPVLTLALYGTSTYDAGELLGFLASYNNSYAFSDMVGRDKDR